MFPSVTFSVLSAVLPVVLAQSCPGSFLQGLVEHLNSLGSTEAANALTRANSTTSGQQWLSQLQNGSFTAFVPTNAAFQNLPGNVSSNDTLVSDYLAYHFVHGNFLNTTANATGGGGGGGGTTTTSSESSITSPAATTQLLAWYKRQDDGSGSSGGAASSALLSGIFPNTTIGRTLLNSSDLVQLEGGKAQVLAWTRLDPAGNVTLLNQANINVTNSSTFGNLFLNSIDGFIVPPGNLSTALTAANATSFLNFTQQVSVPNPFGGSINALSLLESQRGFTLFVPSNDAFQLAQQTINGFQGNQSALIALLGNHVLNGTTLYTPDFRNATAFGNSANFITAAGETLVISTNSSGVFLQNQNGSIAEITRPDVLLENGVFHIINNFLVETATNPAQASSAALSASSAASAMSSTDTLPIGGGVTLTSSAVTSITSTPSATPTPSPSPSPSPTPTAMLRHRRSPNDSSKAVSSPLAATFFGFILWVFAL